MVAGSGVLVVTSSLGFLFQFLSLTVVGRFLGLERFGLYSLVLVLLAFASTVSLMGTRTGAPRSIAFLRGSGDHASAGRASGAALLLAFAGGALGSLLLLGGRGVLAAWFEEPSLDGVLFRAAGAVLALALLHGAVAITLGHGMLGGRAWAHDFGHQALLLVGATAAWFFSLDVDVVYSIYLLATALPALALVAWLIQRSMRQTVKGSSFLLWPGASDVRAMFAFSLPLMLASSLEFMFVWADTVILGIILTLDDVGLYNAALPIAKVLSFPVSVILLIFLPGMSQLLAAGRKEEAASSFMAMTDLMSWISIAVGIVLFFHGGHALSLLFGSEFAGAEAALQILVVGFVGANFFGFGSPTLVAMGKLRFQLVLSLAALIVNVSLNLVLIPLWGLVGAAAATAFTLVSVNVTRLLRVRAELSVGPCHWHTLVLALPVVATAWLFSALPIAPTLWSLAGVAGVEIAFFLGILASFRRVEGVARSWNEIRKVIRSPEGT